MTGMSAPVTTSSRRQELGTASARSLLLTVLGELVRPSGRPVWTATLLALLHDLGIAEKAARQAIMRIADSGWITAERVGRRTLWSLTPDGTRLLVEGSQRIFGSAEGPESWDGQWLLLVVSVPERNRAIRARLRTQLRWAGLGVYSPGVWVSPRVNREPEAVTVVSALGMADATQTFLASAGQLGSERQIVRQAWDLDAIEARYEEFLDQVGSRRPRSARQALVMQIRLVQAWRRFPMLDPGLPQELLPSRWSGHRAAQMFRDRHAAWEPRAWEAWAELSSEL